VKELSVFIDESGDFGPYDYQSPYFIVTLAFHDQSSDISKDIESFNQKLSYIGFIEFPLHAGPLIRREFIYDNYSLLERKRIFNVQYNFTRTVDIKYKSFVIEKKELIDDFDLHIKLTKQFKIFFQEQMGWLASYDYIKVYYDYGQRELSLIIATLFSANINSVIYKKATPNEYKLVQAADMLCTMELLLLKADNKQLSKSEITFFKSERDLRKSYLNAIIKKRIR